MALISGVPIVSAVNSRDRATARLNPTYDNDAKIGASFGFLGQSVKRGRQPLDAAAFAASISRLKPVSEKGGGLNRMERANLAPFLMLNTLGRPLVNSAIDALPRTGIFGDSGMFDAITGMFAAGLSEGAAAADMDAVFQRIDDLEKKIAEQETEIAALKPKRRAARKPASKKKK